jgi:hypothetical protein
MARDKAMADVEPLIDPEPLTAHELTANLRARSIVGRIFFVWTRTFVQLLVVAAIVHVPLLGLEWWLQGLPAGDSTRDRIVRLLPMIDLFVLSRVVEAFAALLVFQRLKGDEVGVARSIRQGLRRIGAILAIVVITAVVLMVIPMAVLVLAFLGMHDPGGRVAVALLPFVVAWLTYLLVYCLPMPVALVEGVGAIQAFRRSRILTQGFRFRIFRMWFLFILVTFIPRAILASAVKSVADPFAKLLVAAGVDWLLASLTCVVPIVLYHDLRAVKEGIGLEELLKVFE